MRGFFAVALCALLAGPSSLVMAQMAPFEYRLGKIAVTEDARAIEIHTNPPLKIEILAGGHTWPRLSLDSEGRAYVGPATLDTATGEVRPQGGATMLALPYGMTVDALGDEFHVARGKGKCVFKRAALGLGEGKDALAALRSENIFFAPSATGLTVLAKQLADDPEDSNYFASRVDMAACKVSRVALGNPDLLVELQYSPRGGWWATGSIEQTLLRSQDGRKWDKVRLPHGLYSLVSSYVVDAREIWLAGLIGADFDSQAELIHSADGGKHWHRLGRHDPMLARVPKGWLEGQKRAARAARPAGQ